MVEPPVQKSNSAPVLPKKVLEVIFLRLHVKGRHCGNAHLAASSSPCGKSGTAYKVHDIGVALEAVYASSPPGFANAHALAFDELLEHRDTVHRAIHILPLARRAAPQGMTTSCPRLRSWPCKRRAVTVVPLFGIVELVDPPKQFFVQASIARGVSALQYLLSKA